MQINWRDDVYEFRNRAIKTGPDKEHRTNNIDALIFGADTESVDDGQVYEPQCFTLSTPWSDDLYYTAPGTIVLFDLLEVLISMYDEYHGERDIFLFFHNLEYDWPQLCKNDPRLIELQRIGIGAPEPMKIYEWDGFTCTLEPDGLFVGTAPHFTITVRRNKNTFFRVMFRDTFSYFPSSLEKALKDMKLGVEKMERAEDLGTRDYRKEGRSADKDRFEEYAKGDAKGTRLMGEAIRELHKADGMKKIRVSGPSYAINSLTASVPAETPLYAGCDDVSIMQLIFDSYRGGRTGGIYHGAVSDIDVFDFHSSYPAAMCSLPSFTERTKYVRMDDLNDIEYCMQMIAEYPCSFLRVTAYEHDEHYPALIAAVDGKLTPLVGQINDHATTGPEVYVGYASGTLTIQKIHELVIVLDVLEEDEDGEQIRYFKKFALKGYAEKAQAAKGSTTYLKAKLGLNSSYGKLIESRHKTMVGANAADMVFPYLPGAEKDFANLYYDRYVKSIEEGRVFEDEYESLCDEVYESLPDIDPSEWATISFGQMSPTGRVFGNYIIPAAASLITGIGRARLLALIKSTAALYWDTDSAMIGGKKREEILARLEHGTAWLPSDVIPLRVGDALGELDCEISGAAGYLAGTKRYWLEAPADEGTDKRTIKKAVHGMPALPFDEVENALRSLATGQNFDYESKPKPTKSKEAKSIERIGSFETHRYEPLFRLDPRLTWTATESGWSGCVKPITV